MVGLREVKNQFRPVTVLDYDLGYFDKNKDRVEPAQIP